MVPQLSGAVKIRQLTITLPASHPPTSVGPPELLHAVPHEDDARQLREGLDDVEVAQGAHFKEGHAVLLGVRSRLLRGNLPLECQM